jgi:hypothetical protein
MNTFKRISAAVLALVAVGAATVAVATIEAKREAEAFLSELRSIQLGPAGYEQVQHLATRFRSHVTQGTTTCTPGECSVSVSFENTWLRKLHLATWTNFGAILLVRNGRLYYVSAEMTLYPRERVLGAKTDLLEEGQKRVPYSVVTKRWGDNQPWQAIVQITPQATPTERKAAFSFNLGCLDKLGGCKDSSDLLPSVWRETKSRASASEQ